jgi:hypothetical protein
MDKIAEQLMMEREPVHQKCLGKGFAKEEQGFVKGQCKRIEPIDVYEIIDEATGQTDDEVAPVEDNSNAACRCTSYVNPSIWWREGFRCPLADHFRPDLMTKKAKGRVGQQKQKKG